MKVSEVIRQVKATAKIYSGKVVIANESYVSVSFENLDLAEQFNETSKKLSGVDGTTKLCKMKDDTYTVVCILGEI